MNDIAIKNFYDQIQFPGHYSMQELEYHIPDIKNPFLQIIDRYIGNKKNILDIGCGTGLISNLFAMRYPHSQFVSIDFADSIEYATDFSKIYNINNIDYVKNNFLKFDTDVKFDCIVCQGVLHHIPEIQTAIDNIDRLLSPDGILILGVYHPIGKLLKNIIRLDYKNWVLYQDQECNPFEQSFTKNAIKQMFSNFDLLDQWPTNIVGHAVKNPLRFSQSGGLVVYIFQKTVLY